MKGETLEESVVGIFDRLGCSIDTDQIETWHQVSQNNITVMVKFTRCKDCQEAWNKKKGIKEPQNGGLWFTWTERNIHQK